MKTPFPWLRSDSQPKQIVAGKDRYVVARFSQADDAKTTIAAIETRDIMLGALRENLALLQEELKNRQFSGVPEYIKPVRLAVERTKQAIAKAEGWV